MGTPKKRTLRTGRRGHGGSAPEKDAPASRAVRPAWLEPPVLQPIDPPRDFAGLAATVLALLVVYALSAPRTVLLEDDGLFLMSSAMLGVSHPPGYPVHTVLGWLAMQVPFGPLAFRVHLLSGGLGALACGALAWLVLRRTGSRPAAWIAALALGVSEHFWSQAIIAEVYTLNALFFFSTLALCQEAAARPSTRLLVGAAAVYGLSLANHWPLMILATPALVVSLLPCWRDVLRRLPLLAGTAFVCAAAPYAWMVWRSNQDPPVAFYGPIRNWREFVFYIARKGYSKVDASPTAGWDDKIQFAAYVVRETGVALTIVGAGLAAAGLVRQWRSGWRLSCFGEGAAFITSGIALAFLLGFDYGFLKVAVFRPYPLVAYGLVALWTGSGLAWVLGAAALRSPRFAHGLGAAALALPAFLLWHNWNVNGRAHDDFAARQARHMLELVEPDGVMLVYSDADTGPIGYLHLVEGERPDVALYNLQGLVFRNRLVPALAGSRVREERLRAFLDHVDRPIYHMTDKIIPPLYAEEHLGFFKRLLPGEKPGRPRPRFHPSAAELFGELLRMEPSPDRWVRFTRNQLVHRYGNFLALAELTNDEALRRQVAPLVSIAERDYYSITGMVEVLAEYGQTRDVWERATRYLARAERLRDESLDDERLGREYYLRAFMAFRLGDVDGAERLFRRSLETYPHPENASHLALSQLARLKGQRKP